MLIFVDFLKPFIYELWNNGSLILVWPLKTSVDIYELWIIMNYELLWIHELVCFWGVSNYPTFCHNAAL